MERKISDLYNVLPFELTTGQKNFLSLATSGNNVFCQGSAGSGKSSVLQLLKQFWGDKVAFTAMTGIANMRLFEGKGGKGTTARVMGLPVGIAQPKHWKELTRACQEIMASSDKIEYLVIEECGGMNAEQLHLLQHRIHRLNKKSKKRRERNIKIILVGDILQLGTIVSEEEKEFFTKRYGSHLFFKSDAFKEMNFQTVYLDEVKRQNDPIFMAALDVLRYGNEDRMFKLMEWLNKRYNPKPPVNVPRICATKRAVKAFNEAALNKNPNELFCYTPTIKGGFEYEDNCPIDYELEVKEGMVAMVMVNDPSGENRYQNGTVGILTQATADGVWIKLNSTGEEILIPPYEFIEYHDVEVSRTIREDGTEEVEYEQEEKGKAIHVPICHAAAITVHKSQGATIDSEFVIDMGSTWAYEKYKDFAMALAYVAASRSTDINNIHFKTKLRKEHIKVCEESITWLYSVDAIDHTKLSKIMLERCVEYKENVND
ncbi:P-loop containing nucleoside triphosphate hydrolase [Vibrio phage 1.161.O._10N.261.48.C5]|nr:P-loop containing nucleoside triphosphate hydrolase [Vibrio phage 1.161.O._10N.261.48.C5]